MSNPDSSSKYFIILDVVGLDVSHLSSYQKKIPNISNLISQEEEFGYMKPVFPAVTSTVQSSILTGKHPDQHGIISNGMFDKVNLQPMFWEQSTNLVQSEKIWDNLKRNNESIKTALLFWQNSMYSNNDFVITPRPIHLESGQMDMWCYSKPLNYYEGMTKILGEFNLMNYWGPFSSFNSSDWIAKSVQYTIKNHLPNLLFAYFPQLDYTAQKYGNTSQAVLEDLEKIDNSVGGIIDTVKKAGTFDQTQFLFISEYGFNDVSGAIPINRILRDKGLLEIRTIKEKEYIDFEYSSAFAMVDHQIAHIYLNNAGKRAKSQIKKTLEDIPGIETVCDSEIKRKLHVDHERSGDLIIIAEIDKWFSYYWWGSDENENTESNNSGSEGTEGTEERVDRAPTFTKTVDIHRKPGYDPLDLFLDPVRRCISTDTSLIKGSHGRPYNLNTGEGLSAFASNKKIDINKDTLNGFPIIDCLDLFGLLEKNFHSA